MSTSVAKLGKLIFGGWFVAAMYLMLVVVMVAAALQGGGLGAVLVPWSTGLLAGAVLSLGVGTKTSSLRRALWVEGRGSWGSAEIGERLRVLHVLWFAGLGITVIAGVLTLFAYDGTQRVLAGLGTLTGLVFLIQPRTQLWSATRALNEFAREVAAQSNRFGH